MTESSRWRYQASALRASLLFAGETDRLGDEVRQESTLSVSVFADGIPFHG